MRIVSAWGNEEWLIKEEKNRSKFRSSILPIVKPKENERKKKSVYLVSSTNVLNKENNSTHEINLSLYIRKKGKRTRERERGERERRISCVCCFETIFTIKWMISQKINIDRCLSCYITILNIALHIQSDKK
jgi:hypothetical protein